MYVLLLLLLLLLQLLVLLMSLLGGELHAQDVEDAHLRGRPRTPGALQDAHLYKHVLWV